VIGKSVTSTYALELLSEKGHQRAHNQLLSSDVGQRDSVPD
jgi:hypothetical protein